jgi:lysophospholipase L1-like esterase
VTAPEAPAVPTKPRRALGKRVVVFVGALVLTVLLCEGVLAALHLPRDLDPDAAFEAPGWVDERLYEQDARTLWRLRRGTVIDEPDDGFVAVHVNARGLRDADRDDEIAKSKLRVLCLGDSVTFGALLGDGSTYPALLQDALRARAPELSPVVVNAGVPGFSSVQGLRLYDELAALSPDVVVWWFGMNDGKPALGLPDAELKPPIEWTPESRGFPRSLRTFRFAQWLGGAIRGDGSRASPADARAAVERLAADAARGGPTTIYVRCPSRLAEKLAGLATIEATTRACRATRVAGSFDALSQYVPSGRAATLLERVVEEEGGRTAVLGQGRGVRETISVEELRRRRAAVARWSANVERQCAELPPGALEWKDLFGDAAPDDVVTDNCHMSAEGCRRAAEALAPRIVAIAKRRAPR